MKHHFDHDKSPHEYIYKNRGKRELVMKVLWAFFRSFLLLQFGTKVIHCLLDPSFQGHLHMHPDWAQGHLSINGLFAIGGSYTVSIYYSCHYTFGSQPNTALALSMDGLRLLGSSWVGGNSSMVDVVPSEIIRERSSLETLHTLAGWFQHPLKLMCQGNLNFRAC